MKRTSSFATLLACVGFAFAARAAEPKPNILFILADDMGYGDVGAYGCKDIRTPNLDRLAESGVRLTDGYVTHSYCGPSRAGLMSGRYQQREGFQKNPAHQMASVSLGLDLEEETMADVMKRAGYRTAAFGKWHLGAGDPFHPNNRGFDHFFGFRGGGNNYFPQTYEQRMKGWVNSPNPPVAEMYQYSQNLEVNGVEVPPPDGYLTDVLTTHALSYIRRAKKNPFFIYLAYNAPHTPLQAPEETIAKYAGIADENRRIYAAMVDHLDMNVGRLIDEIEKLGLRQKTLVVFLSDNGGHTDPDHGANNGPLRGRKAQGWEGGVRVPFIWSWPGGLPAGKTAGAMISSLDLLPTFAALAGSAPQGRPLDGVNVLPWLRGEAQGHPRDALFWKVHQYDAARIGDLKGVRVNGAAWQLFNLAEDIGESRDLAAQMPEKAAMIGKQFDEWFQQFPAARWDDPAD